MAPKEKSDSKVIPDIAVLERRLQNPFGEPSAPIDFKESGWFARWFNSSKQNDHIWRAGHKGWQKVRPDELRDIEQIGGYSVTPDGYIARGERNQEYLMKIPLDWWKRIQHAKEEKNNEMLRRPGALRDDMVHAASKALGDDGFLAKARPIGNVTTTREIIQRDKGDE